jgi:hypothetical protein
MNSLIKLHACCARTKLNSFLHFSPMSNYASVRFAAVTVSATAVVTKTTNCFTYPHSWSIIIFYKLYSQSMTRRPTPQCQHYHRHCHAVKCSFARRHVAIQKITRPWKLAQHAFLMSISFSSNCNINTVILISWFISKFT